MDITPRWKRSEEERSAFVDPLRANIWNFVIPAVASVIGGVISGEGERRGGEAEADAANAATNLQRDIYRDQRELARPGYITGGTATNLLGAQYGIAPQNYDIAFSGAGGGTNGLTSSGGSNVWSTYLSQNSDVAEAYRNNPAVQREYPNINDFARYHYETYGQQEGRQPPPSTSLTTTGSGGTNGLANPMAGFMASPHGQIAVEGFRGVDVPEVNTAFARGGKALSGAQTIALDERGKARLGGAYTDYTNGLRSLAGMNQTASSQISGAAGAYGANAGNSMIRAGEARGDSLRGGYNGLTQGIGGAVGGLMDYGKKNWGWG